MDILLGIFLFISLPAAYIISQEHVKIRSLVGRNSLPIINVNISDNLSLENKADLMTIACLTGFGDCYFTAGQYLKALKFYRDILFIIAAVYIRSHYYPEEFSVIHSAVIDRIHRTLKKLFIAIKRTEELRKLGL